MALLEEPGLLDRASEDLPDDRGDRRAPARRARAWSGPSSRSSSPTPSAGSRARWSASDFVEEPWLERDLRAYFPAAVVERFGAPARRAPAAHAADLHGQRQRGRQRARADVRLPARGRARRRRPPTSCAPSGSPARSPAPTRRWEVVERLEGVDRAAQAELHGRRRRAGRGDHPLVPDLGARRPTSRRRSPPAATASSGSPPCSASSAPTSAAAAGPRRSRAARRPPASRRRSPRAHALRPELRTRPDMVARRGRDRPRDRGRRRASSSRSAPSCGWTGWSASSTRVPASTRMQRWALQAVREDAAQRAASSPRRALRGEPRRPTRRGRRALPASRAAPRRGGSTAFLRSLAREGEPDLAGLTLAVRQLRAL